LPVEPRVPAETTSQPRDPNEEKNETQHIGPTNDLIRASLYGSTNLNPEGQAVPQVPSVHSGTIDPAVVRAAKIAMRPPKITVDVERFSPNVQSALRKARGITMAEGLKLYIEAKQLGYGDKFEVEQMPDTQAGKAWNKNSGPKGKVALAFWTEMFGDPLLEEVPTGDKVIDCTSRSGLYRYGCIFNWIPRMRITSFKLKNYRRLYDTDLVLDDKKTILVGANNSGKTSCIGALHTFLVRPENLRVRDISKQNWRSLSETGTELCEEQIGLVAV
jgi:hypothetical protein